MDRNEQNQRCADRCHRPGPCLFLGRDDGAYHEDGTDAEGPWYLDEAGPNGASYCYFATKAAARQYAEIRLGGHMHDLRNY